MNHPELDDLLGLVRSEPVDGDARQHVDRCAQCTADMERAVRLDAAAERIRREAEPAELVAPPSAVWDRIQAELAPAEPVTTARPGSARRPRRLPVVAAAAAVVGIVLGGIGGYTLGDRAPSSRDQDRPTAEARTPVASGTLKPVGADVVSGALALTRLDDSQSLTIRFSQAVAGPGYVEAWLLDPLTNEMLALGVVGTDGGTVTVPLDADLARFTTVDISREPFDGDPAHSAESIARGVLRQL